MQQAGCHGKQNSNANSLSARRRALAIERAALKAGNLSARGGPAKSASAVPSSSCHRDMIRDASLIFNRNKIVETATSSSSTPISNNNTTVPKGSVKFNETRDRYRRKFDDDDDNNRSYFQLLLIIQYAVLVRTKHHSKTRLAFVDCLHFSFRERPTGFLSTILFLYHVGINPSCSSPSQSDGSGASASKIASCSPLSTIVDDKFSVTKLLKLISHVFRHFFHVRL